MDTPQTAGTDRRATIKRFALTLGLVLAGTGVVLGGAFATFTNSVTAGPQTIASGKVILSVGATNDLGTGAVNIAAGDSLARELDLNSTNATVSAASIKLGISASPSSLLDTDPTNGLQLLVQSCSVAWNRVTGPPLSYSCPGTTVTVLASTSVSSIEGGPVALPGLNSLAPGGKDYLVLTLTLPVGAPGNLAQHASCSGSTGGTSATENLESCSSTLTYSVTATQRAGQSQ